jgi:hypothetical protein
VLEVEDGAGFGSDHGIAVSPTAARSYAAGGAKATDRLTRVTDFGTNGFGAPGRPFPGALAA